MRLLIILSVIASFVFSQDVLKDLTNTQTGKVVAIDSSYIAFIASGNTIITTVRHKNLHSVVLDANETILDENGLIIGPDHRLWAEETRLLSRKNGSLYLTGIASDTLKTDFVEELRKLDNQDRSTIALERIALVLTIELALGVALILMSLLAL